MTPPLRWAGSKRQLAKKLAAYWLEPTRRYVEPFAGSASLFFHLQPKKALLTDSNNELIHFYRHLKKNAQLLYECAIALPQGRDAYDAIRNEFNLNKKNDLVKSAQFLYLNRNCFNGIYRTNLRGGFNVPYSGKKTGKFPPWEVFQLCATQLKNAKIKVSDFDSVLIDEVDARDWVYLDPPYAVGNRRIFKQYSANCFGLDDIKRLAQSLEKIHARGAKFVLSYAQCAEATENFGVWYSRRVYCQRNVSGFAADRKRAAEMIYSNFKIL